MTKQSKLPVDLPNVESKGESFWMFLLKAILAAIVMVSVSISMVAYFENQNTSHLIPISLPEPWRGREWASEDNLIALDIPLDASQPIELTAGREWGRLQTFPSAVSADGRKVECIVKCEDHGQPVGRLELEARGKNKIHCTFTYRDENNNPGKRARLLSSTLVPATL